MYMIKKLLLTDTDELGGQVQLEFLPLCCIIVMDGNYFKQTSMQLTRTLIFYLCLITGYTIAKFMVTNYPV